MSMRSRVFAILFAVSLSVGVFLPSEKSVINRTIAQPLRDFKSSEINSQPHTRTDAKIDWVDFGAGNIRIRNETQKIMPSDGAQFDRFGSSVAVHDDIAVFGAPGDDGVASSSGTAYVFIKAGNKWAEQTKLIPSVGDSFGAFGASVAVDGDTIVVGDNGSSNNESVFVFTRNGSTWTEQQRLRASDAADTDLFGTSVSISGDTVVVGANADDDNGNASGSAYVFTRIGTLWTEQQKLTPADGMTNDRFGENLSLDSNSVVIGARRSSNDTGAAYVFTRSGATWTEQQKLVATDGGFGQEFGSSVTIDGDEIAVGARLDDDNGFFSGSVYVFTRTGAVWTEQQKLIASDGLKRDEFGVWVEMSNGRLAVGANLTDDLGLNSGSAYLFGKNGDTWIEQAKLLQSDGNSAQAAGSRVAISGSTVLMGAPNDEENGSSSGAAYLFGRSTLFDFEHDGKSDYSIFRPSVGQWWYQRSSDGGDRAFAFGSSTDTPVPSDFTGDDATDIAFWRESSGEWFVLKSEDSTFYSFPFGLPGDIAIPRDFDGDGISDPTVFRPSTSTWFISRSTDGTTAFIGFGLAEDKPVIADYDGDGLDDIAIFRPSISQWWINRSRDGLVVYQFGQPGDVPVPADYTSDGKADVAFWRPASGQWFVIRSEVELFFAFPFGSLGDIPVPGDYDGDGTTDYGIFRPTSNFWYVLQSSGGVQISQFGTFGDVPLPSVYSP